MVSDLYIHTRLADATALGDPGPVPAHLVGLSDAQLADLDAFSDPPPTGLAGTGFWRLDIAAANYDPATKVLTGGTTAPVADKAGKRWTATQAVRDMTADELATALAAAKADKAAQIETRRDALLYGGWAHDFGGSVGVKTLQTRELDQARWQTLLSVCTAAAMAGQGATVGVKIRTLDNVEVPLSYSEALNVMLGMTAWGQSVLSRSWALKDAIAAATDQAALNSIDIAAGWPATS